MSEEVARAGGDGRPAVLRRGCHRGLRQRACARVRGPSPAPGYVSKVGRALAAGQDVWGNALLAAPGGPTYAGVQRYLKPLLFARGPGGTALTDSGV